MRTRSTSLARAIDDEIPASRGDAEPELSDVVLVDRPHAADADDRIPRLEVRLALNFSSESNFYVGFTENLSEGGVFVATHAARDLGAKIDLVIALPDQEPIRAAGTVRWHRQYSEANETMPGMGIRFEELSANDEARIRDFARARQPMFFDDDLPSLALASLR